LKYNLTITQVAYFATIQEAAKALSDTARPGFEVQHAFIDLADDAATAKETQPTPVVAPVTQDAETQPAPKPTKPKAVKPAADPAPAPASDAEPAQAPAPAPASQAKAEVVTAAAVRTFLMPFFTADGGARKAEVNALIKTFGANLDAVAPKDLPKLLAAAKEKFA